MHEQDVPWVHGIAMHGMPKYPAGFSHFDYVNPNAPKGGTLRLAITRSFDSLNPYSVRGNRAEGLDLVGESLMSRVWDEPFSLYGKIAESVRLPEDRTWIEFTLRPEARWNDGTPITVEDVLFSWKALRDHGRPNHRAYYSKVLTAEQTGARSVRFTFAGDDREIPLIIGLMPVLQKNWWHGRDVSAPTLDVPVTSGAYKIVAVEAGRRIVYERDKNYWGKDVPINRGQWNFDRIIYDCYRDEGVSLEAFKAGAYDLRREQDPIRWLNSYGDFAARGGKVEEIIHRRPEPLRGFIFNTRREIFADPQVREALTHPFDFSWVNRVLFGGIYRRATSTFPNSELAASGIPAGLELHELEPWRNMLPPALFEKTFRLPTSDGSGQAGMREAYRNAVALLDQAGWTINAGVMRRKSDGKPLSFEILLVDPADKKVALEYARSLKRIGVIARIRLVDSAQYQARLNEFDYDMIVHFWSSTLSPGNEQLYYWGSKAADQAGSRNYAGVRSAVVDGLAEGLANATTRDELVARAHALDRVLMWGHYVVPLYTLGRDLVAYAPSLARPAETPVYGITPEQTWWWGAKNDGR